MLDPSIVSALSDRQWFSDGVDEDESKVLENLGSISANFEAAAVDISRMPFLETLEPADALAVWSLAILVERYREEFPKVMNHENIKDGITDEETRTVTAIPSVLERGLGSLNTVLDPEKITLDERIITLQLSGEVRLTVIRNRPGVKRSMDLLEDAVRLVESFMGVPFPQQEVIYVIQEFADSVAGPAGANLGSHLTSNAKVIEDSERDQYYRHLSHEVSHFYWGVKPTAQRPNGHGLPKSGY